MQCAADCFCRNLATASSWKTGFLLYLLSDNVVSLAISPSLHPVNKMLSALGNAAAARLISQPATWSTETFQCDASAPIEHWLFSFLCMPCAAAVAKANVDDSHPAYNVFCWTPVSSYSYVRLAYNIEGECGNDMALGFCCAPCATRQIYTEAAKREMLKGGEHGLATHKWSTTMFDCSAMEFLYAFLCPMCAAHNVRELVQPGADRWFDYLCFVPTASYGLVRNTYGLEAELCTFAPWLEDIFAAIFCFPCATSRAIREGVAQKANRIAGPGVGGALLAGARKYGAM
mgnify:CR=1 FL=1